MMTRKQSMRERYAEKKRKEMKERGFEFRPKPRKTLNKQSKGKAREMRLYYEELKEWLQLPKNAACAICLCLGNVPRPATECHHQRGRNKGLLRDQRFWIPSCRGCREVPHSRPAWAREMGLLAPAAEWNVVPRE